MIRRWLGRIKPARIDEIVYAAAEGEAVSDATIEVLHRLPGQPTGVAMLDRRLSRRRECYWVSIDGALAHWSWVHWKSRLLAAYGFEPDAPLIGDCYTAAGYRGRGLYPQVLRHIANDLVSRKPGGRVFVLVAPENTASIRGIEKAGFTRIARLVGVRFLVWVFFKRLEA